MHESVPFCLQKQKKNTLIDFIFSSCSTFHTTSISLSLVADVDQLNARTQHTHNRARSTFFVHEAVSFSLSLMGPHNHYYATLVNNPVAQRCRDAILLLSGFSSFLFLLKIILNCICNRNIPLFTYLPRGQNLFPFFSFSFTHWLLQWLRRVTHRFLLFSCFVVA